MSRSISRELVNQITDECCDNIEELLDDLGVEYTGGYKRLYGPCPIHGGDNPAAWSMYPDGHTVRGFWVCRSRSCEKKWKKTLVGFVHGVLSREDSDVGWTDAVIYMMKFLGYKNLDDIKLPGKQQIERKRISNISNGIENHKKKMNQKNGK